MISMRGEYLVQNFISNLEIFAFAYIFYKILDKILVFKVIKSDSLKVLLEKAVNELVAVNFEFFTAHVVQDLLDKGVLVEVKVEIFIVAHAHNVCHDPERDVNQLVIVIPAVVEHN